MENELIHASREGDLPKIKDILKGDPQLMNKVNLLNFCLIHGNTSLELVDYMLNVLHQPVTETAIFSAIRYGTVDLLKILEKHCDISTYSPLGIAIGDSLRSDSNPMLEYFIEEKGMTIPKSLIDFTKKILQEDDLLELRKYLERDLKYIYKQIEKAPFYEFTYIDGDAQRVLITTKFIDEGLEYIFQHQNDCQGLKEWCQEFSKSKTISDIEEKINKYPEGFNIPFSNCDAQIDIRGINAHQARL